MANEEHVAILKQGAEAWNKWRERHPDVRPDLAGASLNRKIFRRFDFGSAALTGADFSYTQLSRCHLGGAQLDFCDLRDSRIEHSDLTGANLFNTHFADTVFSHVNIGQTVFGRNDLSAIEGLTTAFHITPSSVGVDTLELTARGLSKNPSSQDAVETFLRGAGLAEHGIAYFRSLIGKPIEFYSCFISYSHEDKAFARRLHDGLQGRGIRCWRDEHELLPGDPINRSIDLAIRRLDKVLLCCSEAALNSWWVNDEVEKAIQKERLLKANRGREIYALIPLNLDGYLFSCEYQSEFESVLKKRLASDFTGWEHDNAKFEAAFEKVVAALRADDGARKPMPEPKL